jgi:hypothetical protein
MLLACSQGPGVVLAAGPCGHAMLLLLATVAWALGALDFGRCPLPACHTVPARLQDGVSVWQSMVQTLQLDINNTNSLAQKIKNKYTFISSYEHFLKNFL